MNFSIICNSLRKGGAERQAAILNACLKARHLFLIEDDVGSGPVFQNIFSLSRLTLKHPSWLKVLCLPLFLLRLGRFRQVLRGEVVISFNTRPNMLNVLAGLLWGNRAIISERMNPSQSWNGGLKVFQKWLAALIYRFADCVVVNSYGIKAELARVLNIEEAKIRVIYNAIDLELVDRQIEEPVDNGLFSGRTIVTVGRQRRAKGQWHLIRAFRLVLKKCPEAKLIIVGGSGEMEDFQIRLVKESGLEGAVIFAGEQENPFKFVARADIFALPSLHEGLPNALIEAMACRRPVISADCQFGPREIMCPAHDPKSRCITPEVCDSGFLMPVFDGRLLDAGNPETAEEILWAEKLVEMLDWSHGEKTAKSLHSRRRAEEFCIEKILAEWSSLIQGKNR